jgi:NADH-quinone oxidoreductase subunit E
MRHVAEFIGCTPAEVEDVVSYYVMFFTRPTGKYLVQVCRTLSCALRGAERVTDELSEVLGIQPGETDAAREFTLLEVECLGACDKAPVVGVNDAWQECQSPEAARALVDGLRQRGEASLTGCHLEAK